MEPKASPYKQWLFVILASMLLFAPLFNAGNLPLPLMVLELLALAAIVVLIFEPQGLRKIKTSHLYLAVAILALPLVGLIPVPPAIWEQLPGRDFYVGVLGADSGNGSGAWMTLSIITGASELSLWALLPPLVVFVATVDQPKRNIRKLVYLLIAMAVFQAIIGLLQYGSGAARGTYLNRDHLAGFLEMVFPIVLALIAATVGHHAIGGRRGGRWRRRLQFLATLRGHQALGYAVIAVLLVLCLIFTKSRAGVALAMVGLMLALFAFSRRLGGDNVYGTYGTVVAVIIVLAVEIGLAPVLDRFTQDPMQDLRWIIYSSSMEGVGNFFPLGSGAGTYPQIYPVYQPHELDAFINRAHNDYLEWIFDNGILALLLIAVGLFLYARNWGELWIDGKWRTFRFIQVGAGIGVTLILLHSLVDFNLHKPANAIYFAFLLAVFVKNNREEWVMKHRSKKQRTTKRMEYQPEPVKRDQPEPVLDDW